jgi:two-component system chemotaxis response regulator CheB
MSAPNDRHPGPYRVVVVDDSPLYRVRFAKMLGRSPDVVVSGLAADGEEAVRLIANDRPDVVLLDLSMPRMDGFAVLRWLAANAPVPVVVCSSQDDRASVFRALELGAVDFVPKPGSAREAGRELEALVLERVLAAATARLEPRAAGAATAVTLPARERPAEVIAIGASTGGPAALQTLARSLPREMKAPIVVAQHMPCGFTRLFAERLGRHSHYAAEEARDGARLARATIHVAPGGLQTRIVEGRDGPRLSVTPRAAGDAHAPSADALFASAAEVFGEAAVAVVLTGMGDDGSAGAAAVKARGGVVLAESSDTALIYGMPRAALATGRVDAELPLSALPAAFLALTRDSQG